MSTVFTDESPQSKELAKRVYRATINDYATGPGCVRTALSSPYVQIPFPHPCYASNLDANPKNPDVVRLLGFFVPIFDSAILIDAKRQKRRVDGI